MSSLSTFFSRRAGGDDGPQLAALPTRRTLEQQAEQADEAMRRLEGEGDHENAERARTFRNITRRRLRGDPETMGSPDLEFGPDTPAPSGGPSLKRRKRWRPVPIPGLPEDA
jgi:hypothetical protein